MNRRTAGILPPRVDLPALQPGPATAFIEDFVAFLAPSHYNLPAIPVETNQALEHPGLALVIIQGGLQGRPFRRVALRTAHQHPTAHFADIKPALCVNAVQDSQYPLAIIMTTR